jgi:hypothetical protein
MKKKKKDRITMCRFHLYEMFLAKLAYEKQLSSKISNLPFSTTGSTA